MKTNIEQIISLIILTVFILAPLDLYAGPVTMNAVGEYVMGDNDTYTEAKKLALLDAKRVILEKVGTYIESETKVKNGQVSSDEVKQYSAGIVKVEEVSDERSVLANKASVVKVNVRAIVDPDSVINQIISFRNRKDVEDSSKRISFENDKLRKEIEQLNQQLRNVVDNNKYRQLNAQRRGILDKIDANEKGLTLILSGEGLYTAALLDRQKKDEGKEKVRQVIKEIASAYKLSASAPEIDDNGDGTANVRFKIKTLVKFSYEPLPREGTGVFMVTAIDGVNLNDLSSTGLNIKYYATYDDVFSISCKRGQKCKEIEEFMATEIKKPVLFVKLGSFEKKESLSEGYCPGKGCLNYHIEKEYSTRMSLSELKSLSQLKVKILYDSQEYGQAEELTKNKTLENDNWPGLTIEEKECGMLLKFFVTHKDMEVIVAQVKSGSPAEYAGLREGDAISEINGKQIFNMQQYTNAMIKAVQAKKVKFVVRRGLQLSAIRIGDGEPTQLKKTKQPRRSPSAY